MSKRDFRINGVKYAIADRFTGNYEVNDYNPKYDILRMDSQGSWRHVGTCNTLQQGKEKAENYEN